MTDYLVTTRVRRDPRSIRDYVSAENPRAARRLLASVRAVFEMLATHRMVGRRRDEPPRRLELPADSYMVVYQEEGGRIRILRVLHSRRAIGRAFAEPTE